ncbi:MAG: alpha/beta hydrolase [Candidatus Obscuribacterales bacterium]|nr:alpha/beta hydrolase [Candidatus Obscuribacterales bacterium]
MTAFSNKLFIRICLCLTACFFFIPAGHAGEVKVYFATTRQNDGSARNPRYGGKRHLDLGHGSLDYGQAQIVKPGSLASLEQARAWSTYKARMKANDIAWQTTRIANLEQISPDAFYKMVSQWNGTLLLFLHGYDESFDDSLRDTAVIANELEKRDGQDQLPVLPILFSWPSVDNTTDYATDEANITWSEEPFSAFVQKLVKAKQPHCSLHIVAHSLGSRLAFGLTDDLHRYETAPVSKLIFSSADYDYHQALQKKADLEKLVSDSINILVSDRDGPLITSQLLHGSPRLGRPLDPPHVSRKPADYTKKTFWKQILSDAADILITDDVSDNTQVTDWLERQPGRDTEFGQRTKLVDVSELVSQDLGHRLAWPVIGSLLSSTGSLYPLSTRIVHKRPDKLYMEQTHDKPEFLYRYHRVAADRFGIEK